jgi:hypothetical protein
VDAVPRTDRQRELEAMLTDANRQLLERDEEVLSIIAARDRATAGTIRHLEHEVERRERTIREMQATRAWRLAAHYWEIRDRVKSALRLGRHG